MKFYRIDETAAAGSTGTGSIATSFAGPARRDIRHGEHEWRSGTAQAKADAVKSAHTKAQIEKAKQAKAKQKPSFSHFVGRIFKRKIGEAMDMDISGITSQLKGLENKNNSDKSNTVTYGVEDDEGNLMKVTVKSEDAKSFENRLSLELGELENHKIYGYQNSGISLAEVLFNLKDEFNIVDVEFPEIPSDIIYNADKAALSEQPAPPPGAGGPQGGMGQNPDEDMGGLDDDMGSPPQGGAQGGPPGGDMGGDAGGPPGGEEDMDGAPPMGDEDMGDDFVEGEGDDEFKTMFNQLMQLMTAQVEKEKAIADAEAEKARALQAEFSAKAANHEVTRQEELVRMQAEMDSQKKKEKEAKQYADIAKYRVNRDKGSSGINFEGTSILGAVLHEDISVALDNDLDTENMVRREIASAKQKYQIDPNDDDPTKQYKAAAWQKVNAQLQAKLAQIRSRNIYADKERQAAAAAAKQAQQQGQQLQNQQTMNNQTGAF